MKRRVCGARPAFIDVCSLPGVDDLSGDDRVVPLGAGDAIHLADDGGPAFSSNGGFDP